MPKIVILRSICHVTGYLLHLWVNSREPAAFAASAILLAAAIGDLIVSLRGRPEKPKSRRSSA
jgi:hypothetical protein